MKKWKTGLLIFLALFLSFLPGILRFGQKGEKYAGYPSVSQANPCGPGTVEGSDYLRRRPAFCLYAEASGRAEGTGRQGHFFLSWGRTFRERKKFCEECWGKAI